MTPDHEIDVDPDVFLLAHVLATRILIRRIDALGRSPTAVAIGRLLLPTDESQREAARAAGISQASLSRAEAELRRLLAAGPESLPGRTCYDAAR